MICYKFSVVEWLSEKDEHGSVVTEPAAPPGDPGSIPNTHWLLTAVHKCSPMGLMPSFRVQMYMQTKYLYT